MLDKVGFIIIGIGILFNIFGCIGLLRLPDVYSRLQAATKCVTFGTCGIMFGVFLIAGFTQTGVKALIVIVFLLLTAPVAAHAIARGSRIFGVKTGEQTVCDAYEEEKKD